MIRIMCGALIILLILTVHLVLCQTKYRNNVCKSIGDYYLDMKNNPNCYHNPDVYLSVPEIVQRHGYPVQNYSVTTEDGYILTLFRIPYGRNFSPGQPRPPVFIQHGLSVSSMVFVNIGNKSLAFTLADSGYDVWLGNFRGSQYSNKHIYLNSSSRNYWDFTFHENGIYDLPAQLDLVRNVTKQKVFYIGYSMGTTAYFVYHAEYPELAQERIKAAISMAPMGIVKHIESPIKYLLPSWPYIKDFVYAVTNGAINQRTHEFVTGRAKRCLPTPTQMRSCMVLGYLLFGFNAPQEQPDLLPVIVMQESDAIGIKTLSHFIQLIQSGRFEKLDYGKSNKLIYGTVTPPQYNLSNINVPNYFIRANRDPLSTKKNVDNTFMALPERARPFDVYLVNDNSFTHADFLIARDVKELVYDHIVDVLDTIKDELQ